MTQDITPPGPAPDPTPDKSGGVPTDAQSAKYGKELEAWLEVWKAEATAQAVALALAATRADTLSANANTAEVTRQALEDTREDTALGVMNSRADTARGVANAREDTALGVVESRRDTKLGVKNSRKDTKRADKVARRVTKRADKVARDVKELEVKNTRQDTDRKTEADLVTAIHTAYIEMTKSSLDRALKRLDYMTGAVTAITAFYTAFLALVYSLDPTKGRTLSYPAFIPVTFLGLTLILVTVYAALFRKARVPGSLLPASIGGEVDEQRLIHFMDWCFVPILSRRWALHAGIVSLGLSLATLPIAFVTGDSKFQGWVFGVSLAAVILTGVVSAIWSRVQDKKVQAKQDANAPSLPSVANEGAPAPAAD